MNKQRWLHFCVLLSVCISSSYCQEVEKDETEGQKRFKIIDLNWHHVEPAFTVAIWILVASIAKILFHLNKKFGDAVPDSACLVIVGLILGYLLVSLDVNKRIFELDAAAFFLYLLPPIMFDAGYFMPNRQLFENIDSVAMFAFVGTCLNCAALSMTLYGCAQYGLFSVEFSIYEILMFGALISAVDPVAVLSVFEELKVNDFLFINVFGEALFNDGVTVVLYFMFRKFTDIGSANLVAFDYVSAGASFFVIAIGGILIGLIYAVLVSLITKYTDGVRVLSPVFIFIFPYLSYVTAELFSMSSILAIVTCGISMKQYVKGNITHEAMTSVKYFTRMSALCSETVIFMFLGLSCVSFDHKVDYYFIIITIACCTIYRGIFVVLQCQFLNRFRKRKFTAQHQFIFAYSGLRGAIAFGLAVSIPVTILARNMFVTTTIAVVFFTVLLQGITIKPILLWLNVEVKEEKETRLVEDLYAKYFDYISSGIEGMIGKKGLNYLRASFDRFNQRVIKPILVKEYQQGYLDKDQIIRSCMKVAMQDASAWVEAIKNDDKKPGYPEKDGKKDTEFYSLINKIVDQKMNEFRDSLVKHGHIPMITTDDDIGDDFLSINRPYASSSNLNNSTRTKSETLTSARSHPALALSRVNPSPQPKPHDLV